MLTLYTLCTLVAATPIAMESQAGLSERPAAELQRDVQAACGAPVSSDLRDKLVELRSEIGRRTDLRADVRIKLYASVRGKLQVVDRQSAVAARPRPAVAPLPVPSVKAPPAPVLAQRLGGRAQFGQFGPQRGAQPPADYGQQLVELIQTTIAPRTWDVNGGPGTIIYFAPRRMLVVRNSAEVHDGLEQLMNVLPR